MNKMVFGGFAKAGADIGDYLGAELHFGGTTGNVKLSDNYFVSYLTNFQFPTTIDFRSYVLIVSIMYSWDFEKKKAQVHQCRGC